MLQTIIIIIFYFFIDMLHTPTGSCTHNLTARYKGRSCQLSQSSLAQNIKNYVTTSTAGTYFTETEMKYGTRLSKMLRVRNNSLRKRALLFSQVQHVVFQHCKEKERQNNRQNDATVSHTHTYTQNSPCTCALASTQTQMHTCVVAQSNAVNELYIYLCF